MKMYAVFTENDWDNICEMWLVMARDEEDAKMKAVKEGESRHYPTKYTATKVVFLREALSTDAQAMDYLDALYLYSWERE